MRFIIGVVAALLAWSTSADAQTIPGNCGMQLGGPVIFCDTFDNKNPGIPSRTGDLDPNVWGVSRATGNTNFSSPYNGWTTANQLQTCNGTTTVRPPNDVIICNGQLREALNDNPLGCFECGGVYVTAMYPKQPFDFAGRTGTVSFDVSNDSHGTHAAWPEFWMTNLPVPVPFSQNDSWAALPEHGFGIRLSLAAQPGDQGLCSTADNLSSRRWTVDTAIVIRNYVMDDTRGFGRTNMDVQRFGCVIAPPDNSGIMNHVEFKISQNQIDIYATDAGVAPSPTTLKLIASVVNANLTFSRGLIWLEDVHYNADKGQLPSQRNHTFVWDNVAFDGPFTYRDFSYDALDNDLLSADGTVISLGKLSFPNTTATWNVLNLPANPQAAAVRVLFNFWRFDPSIAATLNVIVNGHVHSTPWPYPDVVGGSWRTFAMTIPITDLIQGTNVVQLGSDQAMISSNIDIVLVNVPGGVPVLPGSNNKYPASTPPPSLPTATISANPTSIISGGNSTLTWSSTNTTSCIASGGWTGVKPVSGNLVVLPLSTTAYMLTCSGVGGAASANATVVVNVPPPPPTKTCTITIPPFTFPQGRTTTFSGTANCQ